MVEKQIVSRTLSVNKENGLNADGSVKLKAYNFSGIKTDATDAVLSTAGNALAGLIDGVSDNIGVTEKFELVVTE